MNANLFNLVAEIQETKIYWTVYLSTYVYSPVGCLQVRRSSGSLHRYSITKVQEDTNDLTSNEQPVGIEIFLNNLLLSTGLILFANCLLLCDTLASVQASRTLKFDVFKCCSSNAWSDSRWSLLTLMLTVRILRISCKINKYIELKFEIFDANWINLNVFIFADNDQTDLELDKEVGLGISQQLIYIIESIMYNRF